MKTFGSVWMLVFLCGASAFAEPTTLAPQALGNGLYAVGPDAERVRPQQTAAAPYTTDKPELGQKQVLSGDDFFQGVKNDWTNPNNAAAQSAPGQRYR